MNIQDAFRRVEQEEDYIVGLLRKLIAVNTSIPPGENYETLLDIVEPELEKYGFENQRVYVPEDKVRAISPNLSGPRANLVSRQKSSRPRASIYAHMDVVPIDEPWTRDPFGGELAEGRLYGRGTVDMKGSIAALLGAIKVLADLGVEPRYNMEVLLCTDEEVGFYPGARYLAEEGYFSPHLVWLEPGVVEPIVVVGAAGCVDVKITAVGKSCHSGMNFLGVNAIEEMVPIMVELLALKKEVEARRSKIPCFPTPGSPSDRMSPMFNLNIIRGGTKDNIVAGECVLTINRRYIIEENYEDVAAEIQAAVDRGRAKTKLLDVKAEVRLLYPPVEIDPNNPASIRAREAARAVKGHEEFIYGGLSASLDLGFVTEALKPEVPDIAVFGPLRVGNLRAHAADEFIYVQDLVNLTKELVYYFGG